MDQTKDNNITNIPQSEETAKAQPQSQSHEASQAQPQTSYAVRPTRRQHRRLEYADKSNMLVARNWLNIGFMLFAIVGVILWTQMDDRTIANVMLIIGVVLKIAEVCIRLFKNKKGLHPTIQNRLASAYSINKK